MRIDGSEATQLVAGSYLQPDVSPDGRYAAFILLSPQDLLNVIHVVNVETGEVVPFRIEVPTPLRAQNIIYGRLRWLPDGSGLAYVGVDERNRTGVFVQDFVPDEDTSATRRPLAGFSTEFVTESFGVSPDGETVAISALEQTFRIMLAEGVPGVARPR